LNASTVSSARPFFSGALFHARDQLVLVDHQAQDLADLRAA
jgi:hypothetical protein